MRFITPDGRITNHVEPTHAQKYLGKGFRIYVEDEGDDEVEKVEVAETQDADVEEDAVVKCSATKKDGEPCSAKAVKDGLCMRHYGLQMEKVVEQN